MKEFAKSLKKDEFIPPVTIGAYTKGGKTSNLILDGQQRLTTILLMRLGIMPDRDYFNKKFREENKGEAVSTLNDNDDADDDEKERDIGILGWTYHTLLKTAREATQSARAMPQSNNWKDIVQAMQGKEHYNSIAQSRGIISLGSGEANELFADDSFFEEHFLGFSYLIPAKTDDVSEQKYFSSVFRDINIQGKTLSAQESRESLYYLDADKKELFKPSFIYGIDVGGNRIDFVRCLSLLASYYKGIIDKMKSPEALVAKNHRYKMEEYYTNFIYAMVKDEGNGYFPSFTKLFGNMEVCKGRLKKLGTLVKELSEVAPNMVSIIDADVFYFGAIYAALFEDKEIDVSKKDELSKKLNVIIGDCQKDPSHKKTPSALKFLRRRLVCSIETYREYEK